MMTVVATPLSSLLFVFFAVPLGIITGIGSIECASSLRRWTGRQKRPQDRSHRGRRPV